MPKPKKAKSKSGKILTPAQKKFRDISAACRAEVVGDAKLGKSLFKKVGACVRDKFAGKDTSKYAPKGRAAKKAALKKAAKRGKK